MKLLHCVFRSERGAALRSLHQGGDPLRVQPGVCAGRCGVGPERAPSFILPRRPEQLLQ